MREARRIRLEDPVSMRPGSMLSVAFHTSILMSGLIQPPAPPPEETETKIIPVTIVTLEEMTVAIKPQTSPGQKPEKIPEKTEGILPANNTEKRKNMEKARTRLQARLESVLKSVEKKGETSKSPPSGQAGEETRIQTANMQALVKARIERDCWRDPSDMRHAETLFASILFNLTPGGELDGPPRLVQPRNMPTDPTLRIFVDRAFRAIRKCVPYNYLPSDKHAVWKTLQVNFSGASQ